MNTYQKRRQTLLGLIGDSIALIPSASLKQRSNDTEFPFRQDSNFKYLTGFYEPEALLVLCPHHPEFKSIIFVRPSDPKMELWTGARLGVERAREVLGVDKAYPIQELDKVLPELLLNHKSVSIDLFHEDKLVKKVLNLIPGLAYTGRNKKCHTPQELKNILPVLGQMRLFKDAEEIKEIQYAMAITTKAHKAAMALSKPGLYEYEIQAMLEFVFKKEGAQFFAYEGIVASGNNANTLHYVENRTMLKSGDLLLIDAGSEYNLYATDITRTFPVNGTFSPVQKELYQMVLEVQMKAIQMAKPGVTLKEIHRETCTGLCQGMLDMGIIKGTLAENMDEKNTDPAYRKFYPHGTSHWLGLDVHDTSPYLDQELKDYKLKEGMIFTVEPGLYLPINDESIKKEMRGIGIRIEDDILVTANGNLNLSLDIPKEIHEIEKTCKEDYKKYI